MSCCAFTPTPVKLFSLFLHTHVQLQLESLQQQEQKTSEEAATAESAENVQVSDTLAGVAMETSEGDAPVNQDTIAADNQQVYIFFGTLTCGDIPL